MNEVQTQTVIESPREVQSSPLNSEDKRKIAIAAFGTIIIVTAILCDYRIDLNTEKVSCSLHRNTFRNAA